MQPGSIMAGSPPPDRVPGPSRWRPGTPQPAVAAHGTGTQLSASLWLGRTYDGDGAGRADDRAPVARPELVPHLQSVQWQPALGGRHLAASHRVPDAGGLARRNSQVTGDLGTPLPRQGSHLLRRDPPHASHAATRRQTTGIGGRDERDSVSRVHGECSRRPPGCGRSCWRSSRAWPSASRRTAPPSAGRGGSPGPGRHRGP